MTFLGSASATATYGDYTDIAALHGATKASVDAGTTKLEQIRVSLTAPILATGASSSALQSTGNTSLASIDTKVTGLATAAAQTAGNTKLDSVITLLGDTTTPAPITATQLPSTIGRKASSNSLSVTFASDIDSENHLGGVTGYSAVVTGSVTRPADTIAYAVGDLVANNTTAASVTPVTLAVARINDGTGSIRRIRLSTTKTGNAGTEVFRVHLFKTSPTVANGDNGVFSANGVTAIHIGYVDVTLDRVFSDGAKGIGVPAAGGEITFDPATGTKNVFALLEARSAYTPISGEVFTIALELFRD